MTEDIGFNAERIGNFKESRIIGKRSGIAHLSAHLGVKGRLIQNNNDIVSGCGRLDLGTVFIKGKNLRARCREFRIARKQACFTAIGKSGGNLKLSRSTRFFPLLVHREVKGIDIDLQSPLATHITG